MRLARVTSLVDTMSLPPPTSTARPGKAPGLSHDPYCPGVMKLPSCRALSKNFMGLACLYTFWLLPVCDDMYFPNAAT